MRYQVSDLTFSCDRPLPELHACADDAPAEVAVRWQTGPAMVPAKPFFEWRTPSGGHWLTFARDEAGGFVLTFTAFAAFHVSADAAHVAVHPFAGTPEVTVRHLLLNQVLPLVLSHRARFVLHAAAVSVGSRVCAFVGRSGAGKSTLASAVAVAANGAIVSDDCLVLHRRDGQWWAVPSGAGLRLWPSTLDLLGWPRTSGTGLAHFSEKRRVGAGDHGVAFEAAVKPLSVVIALRRPDDASATLTAGPLSGRDAVLALASEVFRLDPADVAASRAHFDAVASLAQSVRVHAVPRQSLDAAVADVLCRMAP